MSDDPAALAEMTPATLRECPGCGLFQTVPALVPGTSATCGRCGTMLRRARHDPLGRGIALTVGALILLGVLLSNTLMTVQTFGISLQADLLSGPEELEERGMSALAAVVVFTTLLAPAGKLLATLYVLIGLRSRRPMRHLRTVFVWAERLRPWSMIEVFVFGVFVAYVKLGDIVQIGLGPGIYALMMLTFVMIWADSALDHHAVWEALARTDGAAGRRDRAASPIFDREHAIGCEVCSLVTIEHEHGASCPRCHVALHHRKPNSISRTWALVIAAAILYVPANLYPVLTVVQLGAGAPSTILGGVEELISSGMYPLAALVFFASIAIPMLKLIGLAIMLVTTQTGRTGWLRDRTKLYHIVRFVGRWSMIDIFMEALLGALVRFGNAVTIEPGIGAVAFCAVVILTMLAAEYFDPRLMWDAGETRGAALGEYRLTA
ncbi:MAG TPA: paraquat-inducible protein A [Acetobacteraceae bacterium]|jgi:paraquat-inducible protein A|nr:paraquat-inducible protein A [Acetobacteraceae bacterium]